jgi:hypothetical protein
VDSFELSEASGEASVSFGAGSALALGDFYYDWSYASQNTDITTRTHTNYDEANYVIWVGANNVNEVVRIKEDIVEAVKHIKTLKARFMVMTIINMDTWIIGTAEYDNLMTVNSWLLQQYPHNTIDIREYLRSKYDPNDSQDVEDFNNGITPSSLRVDGIHLNNDGNEHVADEVYRFFSERNW